MDSMNVVDAASADQAIVEDGGSALPLRRRNPSLVQVRLVEQRDWPALRELVRKQHERTVFADMPFSDKKFDVIEARLQTLPRHECIIVAEARGEIVGGAWFAAGEYAICENSLMTTVHILAVDAERCGPYLSARTFMRLVRGIKIWSESTKAKRILIHVTTGIKVNATDRLLKAGRADLIGGGYLLDVS